MTAVAYGMVLTTICGQVTAERVDGLKHMQMICGMHRSAYWLANFVIDLLKMEITIGFTILCFWGFNLNYHTAWITYLLFPLAAIPWTYTLSFVFSTESAAQTGVMFVNFGFILFGSTLVHYLRWAPFSEV